jgi:hypothetical protein
MAAAFLVPTLQYSVSFAKKCNPICRSLGPHLPPRNRYPHYTKVVTGAAEVVDTQLEDPVGMTERPAAREVGVQNNPAVVQKSTANNPVDKVGHLSESAAEEGFDHSNSNQKIVVLLEHGDDLDVDCRKPCLELNMVRKEQVLKITVENDDNRTNYFDCPIHEKKMFVEVEVGVEGDTDADLCKSNHVDGMQKATSLADQHV